MNYLHGKTGPTAAWSDQKIDFLSQDQILYSPDTYIRFRLGILLEDLYGMFPQKTALCVDLINSNLNTFHLVFAVKCACAGETKSNPEMVRICGYDWLRIKKPDHKNKRQKNKCYLENI